MSDRPVNFYAGPSILAPSVLEETAQAVRSLPGVGLSVLEISHRSAPFEAILFEARNGLRRLLNVPETHEILFLQGGARGQFAQIPLNFAAPDQPVGIVDTGVWSSGALAEAKCLSKAYTVASSKADGYLTLPDLSQAPVQPGSSYVHTTSNNTIYGTQWRTLPDFSAPDGTSIHVSDMSSDILSRPVDVSRFKCIYAGAQKNAGPSGVTIVILDRAWMETGRRDIPGIWQYRVQAKKDSMFNTPPTLAIYTVGRVVAWLERLGGVETIAKRNAGKAALLYDLLDADGDFYRASVKDPAHRSHMNVTWRLPSDELDTAFWKSAAEAGLVGLKGHRVAGGIRASIYNQMPRAGVELLVEFMQTFRRTH